MTLPLTEEVGGAMIDYLRRGHPVTLHREVFLRLKAPVEAVQRQRQPSPHPDLLPPTGWDRLTTQARTGLHSLRHTVATPLLEAGTPLETIAGILGHLSLESTQIYTKVDIEAGAGPRRATRRCSMN